MGTEHIYFSLNDFMVYLVNFIHNSVEYKKSVLELSVSHPKTIFPLLRDAFENNWETRKIASLIIHHVNKQFSEKIRLNDTIFILERLQKFQQCVSIVLGLEIWTDVHMTCPNFNACCQETCIYYPEWNENNAVNNVSNSIPLNTMPQCVSSSGMDFDVNNFLNPSINGEMRMGINEGIQLGNNAGVQTLNIAELQEGTNMLDNARDMTESSANHNESVGKKGNLKKQTDIREDEPKLKKPKITKPITKPKIMAESKSKKKIVIEEESDEDDEPSFKKPKITKPKTSCTQTTNSELSFENISAQNEHELDKKVKTLTAGLAKLNQIVYMVLAEVYEVTNPDFHKFWLTRSSFENTLSGGSNICGKLNKLPKKRGRPVKINK